ncbi:hypothetical protein DL764_000972 [Monosporascus ibericus]|uniref:Methyltransferase type 11 domain-containing protein n=1 Tax=Monosporascus ibericus TaxID=155417 RepID=A0A4Q4TWC6_9PEZI|nr:hypothetical protein DL764_000972 [Monosporascus ibericus]
MAADTVRTSGAVSHFEQHSSEYEKLAGKTSTRLAATALSALPLSTYGASSHLLDSACGPGIVTKLLLSPSPEYLDIPGLPINPPPRVTGIDIAPSMVAQFTANISTYGWRTAAGFVQDSGDLSRFKDGEFDGVMMNLGIFTLSDPLTGAAEMYRVLKPGGCAVITTWKERRPAELLQSVVVAIRPGSDKKPMYLDPAWETREKLEEVMKAGGFSVDIRESAVHWANDSVEDIVDALSSPMWTAKVWQDWSAEETARWKDEIARQLTEQERATATLAMTGWICVARKPQV